MKKFKELKKDIDNRLKRCRGECCALFFISAGILAAMFFGMYIVIEFLVSAGFSESMTDTASIAAIAAVFVVMWIISVPYHYGLRWYRLQQVRGHSVHVKSVFSCYFFAKRMLQVYRMSLMLLLKKIVLIIPFWILLGGAVYFAVSFDATKDSIFYSFMVVILLILAVIVYLAYTIVNIKYAVAPYIFVLGFDRHARDIISDSVRFAKGYKGYMIEILRSCAFMLLPCVLVFPMVFVIPKMMMIYTAAVNGMIENGFAKEKLAVTERRG